MILRAFQGSDWCWLVGYCDPDVRNGYLSALASDSYGACAGKSDMQRPSVGQTVFTNDKIRARDAMDKYVQQVIDRWSRTS